MKNLVLIILIGIASIGCRKCEECNFVEADSNGNIVATNPAGELCGDELEDAENFQGVTNFGGTAYYDCN